MVIVGGGFGGLYAARALADKDVRVTVLDRRNHHLFQPMLYQVATAALNPSDIAAPIRSILRTQDNLTVLLAEVVGIDVAQKRLALADGELAYDYLIVATGVSHSYFGHDEWAENAPGLKSVEDAVDIRRRMLFAFEAAERESDPEARRAWLTFVVVGAGPTGVEMAGALAELRNDAMASIYPELDPRRTHIVLVEMADKVLAPFAPSLREYAAKALRERGVELRLNTSVSEVAEDGVLLGNGEFLKAGVVIWATGVAVPKVVGTWGLPQGRGGRIEVDADLRVKGFKNIFAIGDVALYPEALPQLAQPALQGGKHAGKQIAALVTGRPTHPFHYHDKGTMATVGRRAAVADIALIKGKTIKLTGTLAWLAWLFVHIVMLLGNRNRLATLVNLSTKYLAPSRRTNPIVGDVPVFEHQIPEAER